MLYPPQVSERWLLATQIRVMCKTDGLFHKGASGVSRYEGGETRLAQIPTSGSLISLKESLSRAFPIPPSLSPEVSHSASILRASPSCSHTLTALQCMASVRQT